MQCDCISYNRPKDYQRSESVRLAVPSWAIGSNGNDEILVDKCIADQILCLWGAGIWTTCSCCGHNGEAPRHVVVSKEDADAAKALLNLKFERPVMVVYWSLVIA